MSNVQRAGFAVFVLVAMALASGCNDSSNNSMGGMMGGGGTGSIAVTASGGAAPDYSWGGGNVFSLSIVRTSNPTVIVWGLVTPGADGVGSMVTHGNVPVGTTQTALPADMEATLTTGVEYRVTVSRVDTTFGYTDFTP